MLGEGGETHFNTNINYLLEDYGIMVNSGEFILYLWFCPCQTILLIKNTSVITLGVELQRYKDNLEVLVTRNNGSHQDSVFITNYVLNQIFFLLNSRCCCTECLLQIFSSKGSAGKQWCFEPCNQSCCWKICSRT